MKTAFYTLGCKLNQSESEALVSSFRGRGFSVVNPMSEAAVYIINSCTVTSMAEQKARRMIRKFSSQNPNSVVIVTGCYAELDPKELESLMPNVIAVGMDGKSRLLDLPKFLESNATSCIPLIDLVQEFFDKKATEDEINRFRFNVQNYSFHSRAFLKIQDGCNHRCSYCRIPLARGKAVSLSLNESLERIKALLDRGYKEVVLTGVNISAWRDKSFSPIPKLDFLILNSATLAQKYGARIRLSSLEPDQLTAELLDALLHPSVTPHLHLPLQSMSQTVLARMNRHYKVEKVIDWIVQAKNQIDNPFLAADIITGFDGESESEFSESFECIKALGFSHLHVFPFSPREGTVSETPISPVPERIRDERATQYRQLSESGLISYWKKSIGCFSNLLVESINEKKDGLFEVSGLTDNYLRPKLVFSQEEINSFGVKLRTIIPVQLDLNEKGELIAQLVSEKCVPR